jgi:hypothetical protein
LFALDRAAYGPVADIIANLVARDVAGIFAGLRQAGTGGDGLAWFSQCETADPSALAALVAAGSGAGLATVLSTTSAAAAGRLAGQAGVLVVQRLADGMLASQLAGLTGLQLVPAGPGPAGMVAAGPPDATLPSVTPPLATSPLAAPPGTGWAPVVTGEAMCALQAGEFVLIRRGVTAGVVPRAVSVRARIPRGRQPVAVGWPAARPRQADWPAGRPGRAGPPDWPAGRPGRAGAPTWASSGDRTDQPPPMATARPADSPPAATPAAAPGVPPWPNAPAWAAGQLRRDQTR